MGTFVRQLDGSPHAGENCGPASVASALRWSTAHTTAPSPSLVRERMGDREGGTSPSEIAPAWETFRDGALRRGYELSPIRYRERVDFARLPDLLWRGDAAMVAVSYAQVPRELRGDPAFTGFHAIFVAGITQKAGATRVKVYDPLCDGRRAGIPGPGPVWWPLTVLRSATGGYAGAGAVTYNAVSRSTKVATPEPDPCAPIREELETTAAELEAAQEALAAILPGLRTIIDEADAISATAREAMAKVLEVLPQGDPQAKAGNGLRG